MCVLVLRLYFERLAKFCFRIRGFPVAQKIPAEIVRGGEIVRIKAQNALELLSRGGIVARAIQGNRQQKTRMALGSLQFNGFTEWGDCIFRVGSQEQRAKV